MVTIGIIIFCLVVLGLLVEKFFVDKEIVRQAKLSAYDGQIAMAKKYLEELSNTKTFGEILNLHKRAWAYGIHTYQLSPEYDLYATWNEETRRRDPAPPVEKMTLDNIFVGGVWGLFTKTAAYWETTTDVKGNKGYEAEYGCNGFGISESIKMLPNMLVPIYRGAIKKGIENFIDNTLRSKEILKNTKVWKVA